MATSMNDATSLASIDSVENLTELEEIKRALEHIGKHEVSFVNFSIYKKGKASY